MNAEYIVATAEHWVVTIEEALRGTVDFYPACSMPSEAEVHAYLLGQLSGIALMLGESTESLMIRAKIDTLTKEFQAYTDPNTGIA